MNVEAEITRKLGITFIDARVLASEAKIAEGVEGYATREQVPFLIEKAVDIFYAKTEVEQMEMKQRNEDLESMKSSQHSRHRREGDDNSSIHTVESNASLSSAKRSLSGAQRNNSGLFRKVVSMGTMRKKNAIAQAPMRNAAFNSNVGVQAQTNSMMMKPKENPLLKRVTSTGGITPKMVKSQKASSMSKSSNRMSRIDHLGGILDIQIPHRHHEQLPLEAIQSGRDWGEA